MQDRGQGRAALDRRGEGATQAREGWGFGALDEVGECAHGGRAVADVPGCQRQLCPEGTSRAAGDALDGGRDRLAGGHREREEFRAVGHGGVNRALAGIRAHGEEAVHAGDPKEGADERAGAQGNERGPQGGSVARGDEDACGDEACHPCDRLAQPEDGHVRVHTGQGEPAGHGFARGPERIEG